MLHFASSVTCYLLATDCEQIGIHESTNIMFFLKSEWQQEDIYLEIELVICFDIRICTDFVLSAHTDNQFEDLVKIHKFLTKSIILLRIRKYSKLKTFLQLYKSQIFGTFTHSRIFA